MCVLCGRDFVAQVHWTDRHVEDRVRASGPDQDLGECQRDRRRDRIHRAALTNEVLRAALAKLPSEQQECLVLRFLNGQSIAETAAAMGRSEGAVKQLQLRAVRNLAKLLPEGIR
jgi:RNA polymerase sigma-70 factor (ECF subfamily)